MANPDLPDEIVIQIFSRLPTKSVGRCRCLSTIWRRRLSTSQFVDLHWTSREAAHLQEGTGTGLILVTNQPQEDDSYAGKVHTIPFPLIQENISVSKAIHLKESSWYRVVGSCRGLVLVVNDARGDKSLLLLNPITLQEVTIPGSSISASDPSSITLTYGFGYDTNTQDYKILSYGEFRYDLRMVIRCCRQYRRGEKFVDVYSVKTGVWKRVTCSLYSQGFSYGAFLNGAIHWLCKPSPDNQRGAFDLFDEVFSHEIPDRPRVIGAFDLTDEVFSHEFYVPFDDDVFLEGPFVLWGCLCVMRFIQADQTHEIWMMKEYGLAESWTKIATVCGYSVVDKPVCTIGDDKILFLTGEWTLFVYDLKEGVWENIVVDGLQNSFDDGAAFVDSLISPAHLHAGSS